MRLFLRLISTLLSALIPPRDLALENMALRQQLALYTRLHPHPQLQPQDRLFWLWLSQLCKSGPDTLLIATPEPLISWQRQGFSFFCTKLSPRKGTARPAVSATVRALLRSRAEAHPPCGAPPIQGQLLKLGLEISAPTVLRLMPKRKHPPSQTWRTLLDNHLHQLVSIDCFTVPTATFRVWFVLVVLWHDRRCVVHFNVTEHPTAIWTAQQMREAFAEEAARRFLLRDRDQTLWREFS